MSLIKKIKREKVQVVVLFSRSKSFDILLLQTNEKRGSFWQNVTGGVDFEDENQLAAATREVEEEIGIKPLKVFDINLDFFFTDRWETDVSEKSYLALFSEKDKKHITLDPKEHRDFKIKSINKIETSDYKYESNYKAFRKSVSFLEEKGLL